MHGDGMRSHARRWDEVSHEETCATRSIQGKVSPSLGELMVVRSEWARRFLHAIA